jgi:hypothetical protein
MNQNKNIINKLYFKIESFRKYENKQFERIVRGSIFESFALIKKNTDLQKQYICLQKLNYNVYILK